MARPSRKQSDPKPAAVESPSPPSPKKVPAPPSNTPAATRVASSPESVAILEGVIEALEKMAKARAEKRHLVRWNDPMDKKLMLSIQYVCNAMNLNINWDAVGRVMGPHISGGAIVQHLAKIRTRLEDQGLEVPPPLKRGGGVPRIATTTTSSTPKVKAATTKKGNAKASSLKPAPKTSKRAAKKVAAESDSDEEEAWKDEDSEAEYGQPRPKRAATAKGPMKRKMVEESDGDEEIVRAPAKVPKRAQRIPKSSNQELSAYGETDISGNPIEYYTDDEEIARIGAGESWLQLEDDDHAVESKTVNRIPQNKSLVVTLLTRRQKENSEGAVKEEDTGEVGVAGGSYLPSPGDQSQGLAGPGVGELGSDHLFDGNGHFYQNDRSLNDSYNFDFSEPFEASEELFDDNVFADTQEMGAGYAQSSLFDNQNDGVVDNFNNGYQGPFDNTGSMVSGPMGGMATYGSSMNNVGNNVQAVPYQIQTSWPSNQDSFGLSNNTSLTQTPAATSAGADNGMGYFHDGQSAPGLFDNGNFEFSTDNGTDMLFDSGSFDNGYVGGGFGGNDYGGNDYGGNNYGGNHYGGNPYGGNQYGGNQYGN